MVPLDTTVYVTVIGVLLWSIAIIAWALWQNHVEFGNKNREEAREVRDGH